MQFLLLVARSLLSCALQNSSYVERSIKDTANFENGNTSINRTFAPHLRSLITTVNYYCSISEFIARDVLIVLKRSGVFSSTHRCVCTIKYHIRVLFWLPLSSLLRHRCRRVYFTLSTAPSVRLRYSLARSMYFSPLIISLHPLRTLRNCDFACRILFPFASLTFRDDLRLRFVKVANVFTW